MERGQGGGGGKQQCRSILLCLLTILLDTLVFPTGSKYSAFFSNVLNTLPSSVATKSVREGPSGGLSNFSSNCRRITAETESVVIGTAEIKSIKISVSRDGNTQRIMASRITY